MEQMLTVFFIRVWNMSITAGYCIAAVFLLRLLFRKMPGKYLYVMWLVVAFRLVSPVSVSTEYSLFRPAFFSGRVQVTEEGAMEYGLFRPALFSGSVQVTEEGTMEYGLSQPAGFSGPEQAAGGEAEASAAVQETAAALKTAQTEPGTESDLQGLSGERAAAKTVFAGPGGDSGKDAFIVRFLNTGKYIWLTGVFVFFVYFLGNVWGIRRRVRMAVRAECGLAGAGRKAGAAQVYECDGLSSPFVFGVWRPRIYLPCGLQGKERELVLLHEQYHVRRKDHLVKLFSFGLLAVYWFHPLVWAAWRSMCMDMEMSCDEKVLEQLTGKERKIYSMTLLSFAGAGKRTGRMSPAFGEYDVKRRIRHALEFKKPAVWTGVLAFFLVILLLVLLGTNGRGPDMEDSESARTEEVMTTEERLYEAVNPYVGDVSANGRLISAIGEALPDSMAGKAAFTTRLQTSEEPYEFHFLLKEESVLLAEPESICVPSILMLALTDNLGVVQWYGAADRDEDRELLASVDVQEAEELCRVENLKAYSESPEKIRELLELLEGLEL